MRVLFHVRIRTAKVGGATEFARKEVDLPSIPVVGTEVESVAWKGTRLISHVTLNVDDASAYVDLGEQDFSESDIELEAFCYEGHSWTLSETLHNASARYQHKRNL